MLSENSSKMVWSMIVNGWIKVIYKLDNNMSRLKMLSNRIMD